MATERLHHTGGLSRRDFLLKAAIGLAAAVGLGAALRRRTGVSRESAPLALEEDSIFMPRADQRDRVLGRK